MSTSNRSYTVSLIPYTAINVHLILQHTQTFSNIKIFPSARYYLHKQSSMGNILKKVSLMFFCSIFLHPSLSVDICEMNHPSHIQGRTQLYYALKVWWATALKALQDMPPVGGFSLEQSPRGWQWWLCSEDRKHLAPRGVCSEPLLLHHGQSVQGTHFCSK